MSEKKIKVTDKRMFTPDGRLRQEFQHLSEGASEEADRAPVPVRDESTPFEETTAEPASASAAEPPSSGGRVEIPPTGTELAPPTFFDLAGFIAQSVALYLGDVELPGGKSAENVEMARLHIDLLEVLHEKTKGNLSSQESVFLDDLLYQLRLRYVQKRG